LISTKPIKITMTNIHNHMSKFTNSGCSLLNLIVEPITTEMRCKYLSTVMRKLVVDRWYLHLTHIAIINAHAAPTSLLKEGDSSDCCFVVGLERYGSPKLQQCLSLMQA
jgi:hypothetical protein